MNTVNANLGSPTFKLSRTQCCGGFDVQYVILYVYDVCLISSLQALNLVTHLQRNATRAIIYTPNQWIFLIVIVHLPVWFVFV